MIPSVSSMILQEIAPLASVLRLNVAVASAVVGTLSAGNEPW